MKILKFALLGVGRIGKMHAANIALNPNCKIEYVFDIIYGYGYEISNLSKQTTDFSTRYLRSSFENKGVPFSILCATETTTRSKSSEARSMISICPLVIGSKEPG